MRLLHIIFFNTFRIDVPRMLILLRFTVLSIFFCLCSTVGWKKYPPRLYSDDKSFCRRTAHQMMSTSDSRGFAEVQPSAKMPAPANSFSPELDSGAVLFSDE